MSKKGFTLIELLIVIAIIAVLSVVIILSLNPAELLRQSRDSTRLSDLSTLRSALSIYLIEVSNPNLASSTDGYAACYPSVAPSSTGAHCGVFTNATTTSGPPDPAMAQIDSRNVDGTGWMPVNFSAISSGAPIGSLPIDPVNNPGYYYAYAATTSLTFELDTLLESTKYAPLMSSDGGDNNNAYEFGTAPGLAL